MILLPVTLSTFTHMWNPTGFPMVYIDENHYMRRAIQVIEGQGPQESIRVYDHPYDHPYFGQIFLAFLLKSTGYLSILNLSVIDSSSIESVYMLPRLLMGALAAINTILVFKIGEIWHSRNLGFVSSMLFAVMPLTWMLKMILLDTLLLPFLLSSILLAFYSSKIKRANANLSVIILSGITLGIAIFTKVPAIAFIPLVGYLVYNYNKNLKLLAIWVLPVLLIPLIWPVSIGLSGHTEDWLDGISYQVERGERNFLDTISLLYQADPVLWSLGIVGGIISLVMKKDFVFVLWTVPYILFIYYIGGIVKFFHFIELLPIFSITAGFIIISIVNNLGIILRRFNNDKISKIVSYAIISGVVLFGLFSSVLILQINTNESFFELSAFISNQLAKEDEINGEITMIGQHWIRSFSWIPMHLHDNVHYIKDVFPERYMREPVKTENVLLIVDKQLKHEIFDHSVQGQHLDEIRNLYHESERVGLFSDNITGKYNTDQYPFTNIKENNGFGLIEVRSNYDNKAYALSFNKSVLANNTNNSSSQQKMPTVFDPNLKVELIASGLKHPTSMAFLGNDDLLVLEKNNGTVKRIVNGNVVDKPILDLNVANKIERGLLGIAVSNQAPKDNKTNVYLYFTESTNDGNDVCQGATICDEETNPLGNRLYKFEWMDNKLVNPQLILDLPAGPGADHNGGVVEIGPDNNLYILIGDGDSCWEEEYCTGSFEDSPANSESSNVPTGAPPVGRGGILRITTDGEPILYGEKNTTGILADHSPLNKYFAYGIRNGFGIAFDPLTNKLWDTENGPGYGDEINLVEPGFNSGWLKVQGWWPVTIAEPLPAQRGYFGEDRIVKPSNLETFAEKGRYSHPEFTWNMSVGVTSIEFLTSNKLGKQYESDLFVADYNNDYLYNFDLTKDRSKLALKGNLTDKIANDNNELHDIVFGQGFGIITDIEEGPDGYLYLLSHINGNVYRIIPKSSEQLVMVDKQLYSQ